jgi:Ca2+-binding RTX toxin-like protein
MALLEGTSTNDYLMGTAEDDDIFSYAGDDTLNGREGNDWLYGGDGDDILNGGIGLDVAVYAYTYSNEGGIDFDASQISSDGSGTLQEGTGSIDTLDSIEKLIVDGTTLSDTISGSDLDDDIYAYTGNDIIFGNAGDDSIGGGEGDDTLDGGTGIDTAVYACTYSEAQIVQNSTDPGAFNVITESDGNDDLVNIEYLQFEDQIVDLSIWGDGEDDAGWDIWGQEDDFVVPQPNSPGVVGSGIGNDTYLLTPGLIAAGQEITISDAQGENSIQLAEGLTISSSQVASNALQLTLSNNAEITILGADQFTYEPGGNRSAGIDNTDLSYADFASRILGTSLPDSGINQGGAVSINNPFEEGATILSVGASGTYFASEGVNIFFMDIPEARASNELTQPGISGFDVSEDILRFDLDHGADTLTLDMLDGVDGISVHENIIANTIVINFGSNIDGDVVALQLAGVTSTSDVHVEVV